jgi:hypothetical protein
VGCLHGSQSGHQGFDLSLLKQVLMDHDPAVPVGFFVWMQLTSHFPEVFAGVTQIDDLGGIGKMQIGLR